MHSGTASRIFCAIGWPICLVALVLLIANWGSFPSEARPVARECRADEALGRLAFPPRPPTSVRIATFNIRILSDASRDDCELGYIAGLLRQFDLVAIQEIRDVKVMDRLRRRLDGDKVVRVPEGTWRAEISQPVGRGVKERYAFLYRDDRLSVVAKGKLVDDRKHDRFIREPYFASFRAGGDEFTLLSIHALYKSKNAKERKLEFQALAEVFATLKEKQPAGRRLILVGDFNDPPENSRFADTLMKVAGMGCRLADGPEIRTTIGDKSLYDNICYLGVGGARDPAAGGARAVIEKFDRTMFQCAAGSGEACLKKASLAVSDHRPVWIDLKASPAE